jgi:hypothetical protein
MKLHASQRSSLAEKICRRWIARKGTRMKSPKVYVIEHGKGSRRGSMNTSWGWCHWHDGYITIHLAGDVNKREKYILLAHEFAHWYDYWSTPPGKWRRNLRPHGERFQRLLWGLVPRGLWRRAASDRFNRSSSRHLPEYQPT